jgi:hypothetical protein
MPGMDGTGPWGMGPMTGGGRGRCNPLWSGARIPFAGYPYTAPHGSWMTHRRTAYFPPWGADPYRPPVPYGAFGRGRGRGRGRCWW